MPKSGGPSNTMLRNMRKMKTNLMWEAILSGIIGLISIILAVYTVVSHISPIELSSSYLLAPAFILIAMALITPFLSSWGCYAVRKRDLEALQMFYHMMAALIVLSIATSVYCFSTTFLSDPLMQTSFDGGIKRYKINLEVKENMDIIQTEFRCCGWNNASDWNKNFVFLCIDTNSNNERCGVPSTCCIRNESYAPTVTCGQNALNMSELERNNVIYDKGCKDKIEANILNSAEILLVMLSLLGISQLLLFRHSKRIRKTYKSMFNKPRVNERRIKERRIKERRIKERRIDERRIDERRIDERRNRAENVYSIEVETCI